MTTRLLLSGVHAIPGPNETYHAVGVFVEITKDYTEKYGLLLNSEPYSSLKSALEDIKKSHIDDIVSIRNPHKDMDRMYAKPPNRDSIGESFNAIMVGWHLDYKKNSKKKRSPGMVTVNAGFLYDGEVHFSCIDKLEIDKDATADDVQDIIETYTETAKASFEFGSMATVQVVPAGATSAKYVMKELIAQYNNTKRNNE